MLKAAGCSKTIYIVLHIYLLSYFNAISARKAKGDNAQIVQKVVRKVL